MQVMVEPVSRGIESRRKIQHRCVTCFSVLRLEYRTSCIGDWSIDTKNGIQCLAYVASISKGKLDSIIS